MLWDLFTVGLKDSKAAACAATSISSMLNCILPHSWESMVLPLFWACPSPVNDVESYQVVSLRFYCCICCFCCGLKASAAAFMVFLCSVVSSVEVCMPSILLFLVLGNKLRLHAHLRLTVVQPWPSWSFGEASSLLDDDFSRSSSLWSCTAGFLPNSQLGLALLVNPVRESMVSFDHIGEGGLNAAMSQ